MKNVKTYEDFGFDESILGSKRGDRIVFYEYDKNIGFVSFSEFVVGQTYVIINVLDDKNVEYKEKVEDLNDYIEVENPDDSQQDLLNLRAFWFKPELK